MIVFGGVTPHLNDDIKRQRWREALVRCNRLLQSGIAAPEFHALCGNVFQQLGKLPPALDAFRSALVLGDETPVLHDAVGLCCLGLRDFEGAAAHFQKALDLQEEQTPVLLLHLGIALLEGRHAEEALPVLHQAAQVAPGMAPVHFLSVCALKPAISP